MQAVRTKKPGPRFRLLACEEEDKPEEDATMVVRLGHAKKC